MNDAEAIDAISEVIQTYGTNGVDAIAAMNKIAYIIGYNAFEHGLAKVGAK